MSNKEKAIKARNKANFIKNNKWAIDAFLEGKAVRFYGQTKTYTGKIEDITFISSIAGISTGTLAPFKAFKNGNWYKKIEKIEAVEASTIEIKLPKQPSLFDVSSNTRSPNTVQGVTGEQAIKAIEQIAYVIASSGLPTKEADKLKPTKRDDTITAEKAYNVFKAVINTSTVASEKAFVLGMIHTDITVYTDREYNKEVMNRTGVTPDNVLRLGYDDLLMEHNKQYSSRLRAKAMGKAVTSYWYVRAYIKDINVLEQLHDISAKLAKGEN